MIIDAVHPVAVIEEGDGSACAVREQAMKPSVQARGKSGVFLIEVDKIGGALRRQGMTALLEASSGPRFREFFPGEDQNDIPSFIRERHTVGEGVLPHDPPNVNSGGLIDPSSDAIESLVAKGFDHPQQLRLGPFPRHFGHQTNDSRHGLFFPRWITSPLGTCGCTRRCEIL